MQRFRRLSAVVVAALLIGGVIAFPLGVIASHQFTDVPTSNAFHNDIDAIADAGITTGCGAGKYCPKAFVTREQMAAFLNRLGALQAGKTPVVNASKVDGRDADDLTGFAYSSSLDPYPLPNQPISYLGIAITAPTSGYVLINASVTVLAGTCSANCEASGRVRHEQTAAYGNWTKASVPAGGVSTMSWTVVFPVAAGTNTFQILLSGRENANGSIVASWAQMTAQFGPFGVIYPPIIGP